MAKKTSAMPTIIIGSDHAGFKTKQRIIKALANKGYTLVDVGAFNEERVDYPQYAAEVARAVAGEKAVKGILVCGTGTGMAIAANKIKGIRAAFAYDAYSAKMAREHNDANVLALRGRQFPAEKAVKLAELFLKTEFSGEPRHKNRIAQVGRLEGK